MKYQIEVKYSVGSSFNPTYSETSILKGSWENEDVLIKNLERVRQHAKWEGTEFTAWREDRPPQPDCARGEYPEQNIWLLADDGTEFKAPAPWSGYFERFEHAKAIILLPVVTLDD